MPLAPRSAAKAVGAGESTIPDDDNPNAIEVVDDDAPLGPDEVEIQEDGLFDLEAETENLDRHYSEPTPPTEPPAEPPKEPNLESLEVDDDEPPQRRRRKRKARAAEPPADDDAADDEIDPADKKYGRRVQRRIAKKTKAQRAAEARAEAAEARAAAYERQLGELQTSSQQAAINELDSAIDAHKSGIDAKKRELQQAIEDGDSAAQAEVSAEIAQMSSDLTYAQARRPQTSPAADTTPDPATAQPAQQPLDPRTQVWINTNKDWFDNPNHLSARVKALEIAREMQSEGVPFDDEYFLELEERLVDEMPSMNDFFDFEDDDNPDPEPSPRAAPKAPSTPVAAADSPPASRTVNGRSTRVVIDDAAKERMISWGFDPANKEHLQEFAQSMRTAAIDHPDK